MPKARATRLESPPKTITVRELKEELRKASISLPPRVTKAELWKLYRDIPKSTGVLPSGEAAGLVVNTSPALEDSIKSLQETLAALLRQQQQQPQPQQQLQKNSPQLLPQPQRQGSGPTGEESEEGAQPTTAPHSNQQLEGHVLGQRSSLVPGTAPALTQPVPRDQRGPEAELLRPPQSRNKPMFATGPELGTRPGPWDDSRDLLPSKLWLCSMATRNMASTKHILLGNGVCTDGSSSSDGHACSNIRAWRYSLLPPREQPTIAAANFNGVPSDSLAEVVIISPQLRRDIVKGKDVNLSSLLIPGFNPDGDMRHIVSTSEVYQLRSFDNRLKATLTIREFILAFTVYRNVMREAYPFRRAELDRYLADIVKMSSQFGGSSFYEYHKAFAARAATLLLCYNQKVDWGKRDQALFCTIFAGHKANSCSICNSLGHATSFCPQTARDTSKQGGLKIQACAH